MARCASGYENCQKRPALFFVKAAAVLVIAAAPYLIFCGVPLFGLPDAGDVTSAEITYFHTAETKTFSSPGDIKLARKAAGHLRWLPFASLTEEDPRYTLVFTTQSGERISLTAGFCNIEYKGRTMRGLYRRGELFVKTIDGIFRR